MTPATSSSDWLDELKWDHQGLIPAIAQDDQTGDVLMVAWMNRQALSETVRSGQAVYWSRSRSKLWRKGESSGHSQQVFDIRTDCDADVILLKVQQTGGIACHTGRYSCFYRQLQGLSRGQLRDQSQGEPHGQSQGQLENQQSDQLKQQQWRDSDPVIKDPGEIYSDDK